MKENAQESKEHYIAEQNITGQHTLPTEPMTQDKSKLYNSANKHSKSQRSRWFPLGRENAPCEQQKNEYDDKRNQSAQKKRTLNNSITKHAPTGANGKKFRGGNFRRKGKTMKKDANKIELTPLSEKFKHMIVHIEGDGDLVLNKMNARTMRMLLAEDRKKIKEVPNVWEDVITSLHWRDPLPMDDTYIESNEEMMHKLLSENAPCITTFGLAKSFGQTVVRVGIDHYSTKFDANVKVIANNGLVPIKFAGWKLEERLMTPQKGSPVVARLNHFSCWNADINISFMEHMFSRDQIIDVVNISGFSMGIGSGRTSGYGRYHVTGVDM